MVVAMLCAAAWGTPQLASYVLKQLTTQTHMIQSYNNKIHCFTGSFFSPNHAHVSYLNSNLWPFYHPFMLVWRGLDLLLLSLLTAGFAVLISSSTRIRHPINTAGAVEKRWALTSFTRSEEQKSFSITWFPEMNIYSPLCCRWVRTLVPNSVLVVSCGLLAKWLRVRGQGLH